MQLPKSEKLQNYLKKLRPLLNKYKSLNDIILFGSVVKGSSQPHDIDVALFLKNSTELSSIKEDIRKEILHVDIEIIENIYSSLWVVLMREGLSVCKSAYLFELYKLQPVVLYHYSLSQLTPVQKVQFSRGLKKLVKDTHTKIISRCVLLVPIHKKIEFDEFLERWHLLYETQSFELFPLLRKETFV